MTRPDPRRIGMPVLAVLLLAAACTPTSPSQPPTAGGSEPDSTRSAAPSGGPEAATEPPPPPLLELGDPTPLLVAPGDRVPVDGAADRVELVSAGGRADVEIVDGAVVVPADADGELLLVEHRGDTLMPRVLYAAEGPGVWVVPDHTELTPGDVALVWILHRDLPTPEIFLMGGELEEEFEDLEEEPEDFEEEPGDLEEAPQALVTAGDALLTLGVPEPIDLGALDGGPLVLPHEVAEALDDAGALGLTVLTEIGVYPQEATFEFCDTPGIVEGSLEGTGRIRAVSLAPAGRTGTLVTADGGFRFLAPPGPIVLTGLADDGTPLRATGRADCGRTATVGDTPTSAPESLDLARVRIDPLGRAEPDRACRTATVVGAEAAAAALELDRLDRLDVLTGDDVERAIAAVADGVLRPLELVAGLASRWSPGGLTAVAEPDGTAVFDGTVGLRGDPVELVPAVAATSLCPTAGIAIGEPGETVSLPVRVTDLAGTGQRTTVEVVDARDDTLLGVADTDEAGSVTVTWTAPDAPVVQPLVVTASLPVSGAPPSGSGFHAAAPPSIPATGATSSTAFVGGVWQLVGSNWLTFSEEVPFLGGFSMGAALLACTSGPRLRGPWHGVVWLASGGVMTLGMAGIALSGAIGLNPIQSLVGFPGSPFPDLESVVSGIFTGWLGVGELESYGVQEARTRFAREAFLRDAYGRYLMDLLLTQRPPASLGPKDGAVVEVFPVPFEDGEISPGGDPKVVSREPFPLVSLTEVTRPRLSLPVGTLVFGSPATGTARLFNEGGTVTHARFFWTPSCGLDAETFEQAKRDFETLQTLPVPSG
ncbi:MAG TPA: hypothetical protein ENK55_00705 [Actinobacteria bacterium]|nr:hypothetical protein [Actinomycetota bacterium]